MKLARTLLVLLASATVSAVAVLPAAAQEATPSPVASQSTPTPAPSPCTKPTYEAWSVSPERAAAGDPVTVSGARQDLCMASEPPHDIRLLARPQGAESFQEVARATTGSDGRFSITQRPTTTTTYQVTLDGRPMNNFGSTGPNTVVIDRVSGSCRNALTLYAGTSVSVGSPVLVNGNSSDTSTVSISFRKRGQTAFSVRRQAEPAGQQGVFNVYFTADDDYRLYASKQRCDSQPILVTAAPVITGPATVRKGSTVTLAVRATPGMPLAVAFRRSGQTTFAVRRTGTADSRGVYSTTYKADADYQYYAAERPGQQSARRITQAR